MRMTEQQLMAYQGRQLKYSTVKPVSDQLRAAIDKANAGLAPPKEDEEQAALVQYLYYKGIRFFAVPNGGHRSKAVAGKLKMQGVTPGVQDLIVMPPIGSTLPLLFIEMKKQRGGQVSKPQRDWAEYIEALSATHPVRQAICPGFEAAKMFIEGEGY